jgi:hypothetical protein
MFPLPILIPAKFPFLRLDRVSDIDYDLVEKIDFHLPIEFKEKVR